MSRFSAVVADRFTAALADNMSRLLAVAAQWLHGTQRSNMPANNAFTREISYYEDHFME